MSEPLLVQYRELSADHFDRHPVWINAHSADEQEPWYELTDEETFRPWLGALPVGVEDGFVLVRATFTLADGTVFPGFVTPQERRSANKIEELLQAVVFLPGGGREEFWNGLVDRPVAERAAFLADLGKSAGAVFPVHVATDPALARGHASAVFTEF